jgi:Actin like proteins N terminal domain
MVTNKSAQAEHDASDWPPELDGAPEITVIWDGGAGDNKISSAGKRYTIPSAVASVKVNQNEFDEAPKRKENKLVIKWNDRAYAIGQYAIEQRKNIMRRLDQEGLGGETHQAILLGGLVLVAPLRAYIHLVTNIPISFWSYRERMYGLAGVYQGYYGNRRFYYYIDRANIELNPESRGTMIAHCFSSTGDQVFSFENRTVACIDSGTHTVNVGVYNGLKYDPNKSFTIPNTGMVSVWKHCQSIIAHEYGREPSLDDIEAAMRHNAGVFNFGADSIDLNLPQYAPQGYQEVASKIISEIQNELEGGRQFAAMVGGGGLYPHIVDYLADAFPKHILRPEKFDALQDLNPWEYNVAGLERRLLNKAARNGKESHG